jgi:hypothetical protein
MSEKPLRHSRFATEEDCARISTSFTLPGRLAKQAADWQKKQGLLLEPDLSEPESETQQDPKSSKP